MTTIATKTPKDPVFPWDNKRELLLLKAVQTHGVHKEKGNRGVNLLWDKVNDTFFLNVKNDLQKYKGSSRKLIQRYERILEEGKKYIESGNLSRETGNLSEKFKILKVILDDMEQENESKLQTSKEKAIIQEKMVATEKSTIGLVKDDMERRAKEKKNLSAEDAAARKRRNNIEGYGVRKSIDGVFTADDGTVVTAASSRTSTSTSKQKPPSAEEILMMTLYDDYQKEKQASTKACVQIDDDHETETKKRMITYVNGYSVSDILADMDVSESTTDKLVKRNSDKSIIENNFNKINSLITIYCGRGNKFGDIDNFLVKAKDCDIGGFCAINIFNYLTTVRETVDREENEKIKRDQLQMFTPEEVATSGITNAGPIETTGLSSLTAGSSLDQEVCIGDDFEIMSEGRDDDSIPTTDDNDYRADVDDEDWGEEFLIVEPAPTLTVTAPLVTERSAASLSKSKGNNQRKMMQQRQWSETVRSGAPIDGDDSDYSSDNNSSVVGAPPAVTPAMIMIDIDDAAAAPPTTGTTGATTVTEPLAQESSQALHDAAATAEQLPAPQSQSLLDDILAAEGDTNKERRRNSNKEKAPTTTKSRGQEKQTPKRPALSPEEIMATTTTGTGRLVKRKIIGEAGESNPEFCEHSFRIKTKKCPNCFPPIMLR